MEVINQAQKLTKTLIARWTIADFFTHVKEAKSKQIDLNGDKFALGGLSTKFHLRIIIKNSFIYYLYVDDMAGENSVEVTLKFWLENDKGEKCAQTEGKILLI
jgi:hypothetical protein